MISLAVQLCPHFQCKIFCGDCGVQDDDEPNGFVFDDRSTTHGFGARYGGAAFYHSIDDVIQCEYFAVGCTF